MQSLATMETTALVDIVEHDEADSCITFPTKVMAQYAAMELFLRTVEPGDCMGFGWEPVNAGKFNLMYRGDGGWESTDLAIYRYEDAYVSGWIIVQ